MNSLTFLWTFWLVLPQSLLEGNVLVWIGINNRLKSFLSLVSNRGPIPLNPPDCWGTLNAAGYPLIEKNFDTLPPF
jgi:hypothetical protein